MRCFRLGSFIALGASVACSDPTGPELTEIVVTVDWPVAREQGFTDARWQLIRYDPESPDLLGPRGPIVQSGVIGASGSFVVRYDALCEGGVFGATGHRIEVFGYFEGNEGISLPECATWAPHQCSDIAQTVGLPANPPFQECRPPEN